LSAPKLLRAKLRLWSWIVVSIVGFLEAWVHRFQMDPDGVSYLDVAWNYLHGDWHAAVNAYWSPLYSWILAVPISFLHSSLYWESTLLHMVNFATLLASYAGFEFLLGELLQRQAAASSGEEALPGLSESAWRIIGLALFLYSALFMTYYDGTTPDLCVTVAVYAMAGLLVRIQSGRAGWGTYLWLGVALGLSYLAKAAMFPLSFAVLGIAIFASSGAPRSRSKLLATVFVFALLAGPWIAVLSHSKGRFTFGDTGKLNYAYDAGIASGEGFWADEQVPGIQFAHPLPRVGAEPVVFVFPGPVSGTYPPWYDSSYWLEGVKMRFRLVSQLQALHKSYDAYMDILVAEKEFLIAFLALLFLQEGFRNYTSRLARLWVVWLPALAGLGMYALLHIETRFIAAQTVLIWISLFAALRFPKVESARRWAQALAIALLLTTSVRIAQNFVSNVHLLFQTPADTDWSVAQDLHRLGVPLGGAIALIGMPKETFYFAHLAHVRIVAAVPPQDVNQYWFAPPDVQARVSAVFAGAGATAVVTSDAPQGVVPAGWVRLDSSDFLLTPLSGPSKSTSASN